jgi:hypothetical protein
VANNLAAFSAEVWSKAIISKLRQLNVMLGMANTDYTGEITNVGSTVWVRTFGNVTMGAYTKGSAIAYQDLAPTKESLVIADAQYFAFNVDAIDQAQNDLSALDGYSREAAIAMNNLVEAKLMAQYSLAHANNRVTGAASADITITASNAYSTLVDAAAALDAQNAPQEDRWACVSPIYKGFLMKDTTNFIRSTDLGDTKLSTGMWNGANSTPGFIGQVAGFNCFVSNAVPVVSTSKYHVFGQGKPIAYAAQIREMEALRLQTTFADAVRGLLLHDATVFTENKKRLGYIKTPAAQ